MRVLAIVHQNDAGPGVFAEAVRECGASLEVWQLPQAAEPPDDPLAYDAVMAFGGGMHPDQLEQHPWLAQETAALGELLDRGVPLLGVCLGSELLAAAAGGRALRSATPEIGWFSVAVAPEAAGDPLIGTLAPGFEALEWHSYETSLPPGAVALARSEGCLQAYRLGETAWGIQFHAEVTLTDFEAWLDDYGTDPDAVALGLDPDQLRAQTRDAIAHWNRLGHELCRRFLGVVR